MSDAPSVSIFGIRHHGPGSARSLLRALANLAPDMILVEGPSDAAPAIAQMSDPGLVPPVTLLLYDPATPSRCAMYPFAEFSPEWQAIRFAHERAIPVSMMDLPALHMIPLEEALAAEANAALAAAEAAESAAEEPDAEFIAEPMEDLFPEDPLAHFAEAAGYDDVERWWDSLVEQRREAGDIFPAILEMMTALRTAAPKPVGSLAERFESIREAWMRQTIRQTQKDGARRIAVICGAWHAPALATMPPAKDDAARLRGLPKAKLQTTWAPWTYPRLAASSGYRAGVASPGWYEHLWTSSAVPTSSTRLTTHWLARAAAVLREEDFDVSSAHLIETVRLAEALTAMRGNSLPGLGEIEEAIVAVMLMGDPTAMELLQRRLVVGTAMGKVPEGFPKVPLQSDFEAVAKTLRLKISADFKDYALDLREPNDLARSQFLHRLRILRIDWGKLRESSSKGTFRETWRLAWEAELTIRMVEASRWGSTVKSAATAFLSEIATDHRTIAELAKMIEDALLASLDGAIPSLVARLKDLATTGSDVAQLMDALPALARSARYGTVRATDLSALTHVLDTIITRICIGLPTACGSLDDEAADLCVQRLRATQGALALLERADDTAQWHRALSGLDGRSDVHGSIGGCATRILFDEGAIAIEETGRRLGLALSRASDPHTAGYWTEGFLGDSALLLLHNATLWSIIDAWVVALSHEAFRDVLPVLRRAFSAFPGPERVQIAELVARGANTNTPNAHTSAAEDIDLANAELVIPTLALIFAASEAAP